jgi:hypothetical protein
MCALVGTATPKRIGAAREPAPNREGKGKSRESRGKAMSDLRETAIAICLAGTAAIAAVSAAAGPLPTSIAALNAAGAADVVRTGWDGSERTDDQAQWPLPPLRADIAARLAEGGYYPFARYPTYYPWYYYSRPAYSSYGDPRPHDDGYHRSWDRPY